MDAVTRRALDARYEDREYMVDECNSSIYDGEMYYEFEGGFIVKPENLREWKNTGDIVKIMTALGRQDELNDDFDAEFWSDEIFTWGDEEFLNQCDYDIHYA